MFNKEADFENTLITLLATKSWEKEVLRYPTEEDLIATVLPLIKPFKA